VGDVAGPAAVWGLWGEVLLEHVLRRSSSAAGFAAGPEGTAELGPQTGTLHQASNTIATDGPAGRMQFLVVPLRAVKSPVLLEHCLDFSGDQGVIRLPLYRQCLVPVLPGVLTAAVNPRPTVEPGDGVLIAELIDQVKPLGGSCSLAKWAFASLKKFFSS
jgi:hypothetical protein